MNPVQVLVELQNLDLKLDDAGNQSAALEAQLADEAAVVAAHTALTEAQERANGLRSQLGALELETQGLTDKLKQVSERLYSGRIGNPKELAGLNLDAGLLQKHRSELEDRELALMEQIETVEAELQSRRAAREKIDAERAARVTTAQRTLETVRAASAEMTARRDALRTRLTPDILSEYDRLRRAKRGRAVAQMKASTCAACGYAVPSGLVARVKAGAEIVYCANCERILAP